MRISLISPLLSSDTFALAGVVGKPRVRNFRVRMHGRIRNGREDRWMPFAAEQYNVVDPAARLFYLNASMFTSRCRATTATSDRPRRCA